MTKRSSQSAPSTARTPTTISSRGERRLFRVLRLPRFELDPRRQRTACAQALRRRYAASSMSGGRSFGLDQHGLASRAHERSSRALRQREAGAGQDRLHDRHRLRRQLVERCGCGGRGCRGRPGRSTSSPKLRADVDEQREVDAVAGREGQLLEDLAAPGVLACERLHDRRQVGEEQRHERASDELGDPAALAVAAVERAVVEALHEARRRCASAAGRRAR